MIVPVVRKITETKKIFIERALPKEGSLKVKKGSKVEPFDRLGECMYVQNELKLPKGFKPEKFRDKSKYYRAGILIGRVGKEKIKAPYNGTLWKLDEGGFIYWEEEKRYVLLSGVWGTIHDEVPAASVLIETQVRDLLFAVSTSGSASGELLVLPNPSEVLKESYLEKFSKGIKGKVVYVGHFIDENILKKAHNMGASAIFAGSCNVETFNFAKSRGIKLGLISGFGKIPTPQFVFKALDSVSYRYVFFDGKKNLLRIPIPLDDQTESTAKKEMKGALVKKIQPGMRVQVFTTDKMGRIGKVDRVSQSSILVKFEGDKEATEVHLPNFLILE